MMHSRSRLLFLALLLAVGTLALPWAASAQEPVTSRLKLSIGGYIKPEILYKTNAASVGVAGNPIGVSNFGFTAVPQKNTTGGANGTFSINANESRFNFTITAPDWRGIKPTAFLEMDFAGNDGVIYGYCPGGTPAAGTTIASGSTSPCAVAQNAVGSPQTSDFGYGGFRLRHAFMRLAGEGLGGSWNLTMGQTWGIFGMLPFYAGSTLDFGGGSVWGQRQPQFTFSHTLPLFRDFQWINTVGLVADTTFLTEAPAGEASSRFVWTGWQGWNGGARSPLHFGISARVQREKVQQEAPTGATNGPVRALSAVPWGVTGGLFVPILPGTSATDRTWGLSAMAEGGWGEGANAWIPSASPLGGVQLGANNLATPGAAYFKPSSCASTTAAAAFPGVNLVGTNPCTSGGTALMPTEISLVKSTWTSYSIQFYLPANLWLSGGQKYIWFTNGDNAFAQTCNQNLSGSGACTLITPATQGLFSPSTLGASGGAAASQLCLDGECVSNNATRDGQIKRMAYTWVALFYDMTPNIRWGFEWGMHDTNRKNSIQDNQSHRWQFGAYYFF